MASKSNINHDDEAASSVGLGFLPSALGSSTTGVPVQRVASPVEQEEAPVRDKRSDTVSAQSSRGKARGTHSLASRIQKPSRSRSALEVLQASQVDAPDGGGKAAIHQSSNVQTQQPVRAATVNDILLDVFGTIELRTDRIENLQVNKALWASHHARAMSRVMSHFGGCSHDATCVGGQFRTRYARAEFGSKM